MIAIVVHIEIDMKDWMQEDLTSLVAEYGTVPPPWVMFNEHPYSMRWRMGSGESHMLIWWEWWPKQSFTEDQKIEYFRQWPPPHCWLEFVIQAIWKVDALYEKDKLPPYFNRMEALGFGSHADFERDLVDPKWRK